MRPVSIYLRAEASHEAEDLDGNLTHTVDNR
jgi:hypothetical protein